MFRETSSLGGLSIQLAYYRGFGEFHAGDWSTDGDALLRQMKRVRCVGGRTQIERVLRHAVAETKDKRVQAVVFVGDMVEEDVDRLCHVAGELGVLGVPVFCFHEGGEVVSARVLQQIARSPKEPIAVSMQAVPNSFGTSSRRSRSTPPAGARRSRRTRPLGASPCGCSPTR